MGMFDWLHCEYPLPDGSDGTDMVFQTKDTDAQMVEHYKIDADGILWHQEYDIEDHSDPTATGINRIIGSMTPVNHRWVKEDQFTGTIEFYDSNISGSAWRGEESVCITRDDQPPTCWDYEAIFDHGVLQSLTGSRTTPTDLVRVTSDEFFELVR
jgi:hypothetical protein